MSRKKNQKNQTVSARRLAANRQNALKSTGPRTAEGKAKSAQNATTHGLANPLSKSHLLHSEDETQFQIIFAEYVATYRPQHRDEYDLLTEAVYAKWRQQRLWLGETGQIELSIARHESALLKELPRADEAAHLANGIAHSADLLRLYQRYNAQLHRQYLRCLAELRTLQADRLPLPDDSPNEPILGPPTPGLPSSLSTTPPAPLPPVPANQPSAVGPNSSPNPVSPNEPNAPATAPESGTCPAPESAPPATTAQVLAASRAPPNPSCQRPSHPSPSHPSASQPDTSHPRRPHPARLSPNGPTPTKIAAKACSSGTAAVSGFCASYAGRAG